MACAGPDKDPPATGIVISREHLGQHEIIIKVNSSLESRNLGFIVSADINPPAYDNASAKSHVFYTRKFNVNTPRYLYLSTNINTPNSTTAFSTDPAVEERNMLIDSAQYLAAATQYYIHIYDTDTRSILETSGFRTLARPDIQQIDERLASITAGDQNANSFDLPNQNLGLEFKATEALFIPMRIIQRNNSAFQLYKSPPVLLQGGCLARPRCGTTTAGGRLLLALLGEIKTGVESVDGFLYLDETSDKAGTWKLQFNAYDYPDMFTINILTE